MARKPKTIAYEAAQSDEDAAHRVGLIGSYRRGLQSIEGDLSDAVAALKAKAEQDAAPLREKLVSEEAAVQAWCAANRARLTNGGKKKFHDFGSGIIKWRFNTASVSLKGVADVVERLKKNGLRTFIRVSVTVDKEAILKSPEKVKGIAGITIVPPSEHFVIEPVEEKLSDQASEAA